jgi:hypothetical protein
VTALARPNISCIIKIQIHLLVREELKIVNTEKKSDSSCLKGVKYFSVDNYRTAKSKVISVTGLGGL